jgi:BirA family biotin operon repressor/biotin-[acetyl-CoA-carboxylase] ligase
LNIPLLDRLREAGGQFVALDELGPDLGRVRFDLEALAQFGFGIERHPYRGAAYGGPAERLCPDQIEHGLATRWIGRRVAIWNRVASTNDLAARTGASVSNDGLVILAEEQTAGRGRRGRSWVAPARSSILMSVVLHPPPELASAVRGSAIGCAWLTALGAVATAEVVSAWTGRQATIKWPNDVRAGGRKIAGVLVERALLPGTPVSSLQPLSAAERGCGVVIGIGLNANMERGDFPEELRLTATSLQLERGGEPVDRSAATQHLIRRLDHWYDLCRTHGAFVLNDPWRTFCEHVGKMVHVTTPSGRGSGRLVDLDLHNGLTLLAEGATEADGAPGATPRLARVALADILTLEDESHEEHNGA